MFDKLFPRNRLFSLDLAPVGLSRCRFTDDGSDVFFWRKVFAYYFFFFSPVLVFYILNLPPVTGSLEGFIVLPQLFGLFPCEEAKGLSKGGGEL